LPRLGPLRAVIAGKDDNGVTFDARIFDRIQNLPGAVVHLGQAIGPIAVSSFSDELGIWQRRHMNHRLGNIGIERLAGIVLDELYGVIRDLGFHGSFSSEIQLSDLPRFFTLAGLVDGLKRSNFRTPTLLVAD